jgi:hypothetical protein
MLLLESGAGEKASRGHARNGRHASGHSFSPIRTVTVGTGVSPVQPPDASGGSRAITAGEELHLAPRTTVRIAPASKRVKHFS